ncbi:hypothetical protein [Thermodesulfovibrio yellowstonii]|uniref:hypothetical protein n=1 Tax=Thermodesulfovibrio yellowstonii TaxID=28262 RepID=UPI0024B37ABD|nr:hypothetical protein [Thermodesulfovibrio yellowstonii]MDI6865781.1 hypothetical protein [Thermodesulfovibrio yellowstonii]
MDTVLPYILRSGDWVVSFIFLYAIIKLYVMKHIEELGNKLAKLEKKIEDYNSRYELCSGRKIDRAEYYADYSEFKAELQELRKDIKNIYFMLGGDKCLGMKS